NPLESDSPISQGICIDEDEAALTPSLDGLTVLHYAVLVPDEMGVHLTEILLGDGKADPNQQATLDDSFKLKNQYNAGIQSGNSSIMRTCVFLRCASVDVSIFQSNFFPYTFIP
ncbi:unnamed protein product, partial [Trichobilharzia regenti]